MNADTPGDAPRHPHALIAQLPSMVAYWDTDLHCQFANQAYEHRFGVDPAGLVGTSLRDLLGPELFALKEPHIRAALRGEERTFERILPEPGGAPREGLASFVPHRVDGKVVGFLVQVIDITTLKATQAALQRSEQTLREVFRLSHEGILVADSDGRCIDANDALCDMLGRAREEILGETFEHLIASPARDRRAPGPACLEGGEHAVQEWLLRRKDGSTLPVEASARLLPDGRRVGFLLDITAHTRALAVERDTAHELERTVRARTLELSRAVLQAQLSEDRFRGIFNSTSEAIITTDDRQQVLDANPAAAQMFRCEVDDMIGAPLERFIPIRFRDAHRDQLRDFGERAAPARPMGPREVLALRANGEEFPIEAAISHLTVGGQRLYTVIHRDVTARRQLMADLESSQSDLRHLLAARETAQESERHRIAQELHDDLQQTLGAIKINIGALTEMAQGLSARAAPILAEVQALASQAIESTRRIVNDLRPQMLEALGLAPSLEALASRFGRRHGIDCRFEPACGVDTPEPASPAITTALYRVTQEALNNVARHAHATAVRIALQCSADARVVLRIQDDGIGLRDGDLRKPGSFGLMGIRERMRSLGGSVRIAGVPGVGTTLEASVPITPVDEPVPAPRRP